MSGLRTALKTAKTVQATDLRKFGFIFATILAGLFYFLIPWLKSAPRPLTVLWVALTLAGFAAIFPAFLRPVFFVASVVGGVLGAINNRIILSLIFFLIFSPLAFFIRLFTKKDPMRSHFDKNLSSYRVLRENKDLVKNREKAF